MNIKNWPLYGPTMTKSLHIALENLGLERAWIVHPGKDAYPVHPKVSAVALPAILQELAGLGA